MFDIGCFRFCPRTRHSPGGIKKNLRAVENVNSTLLAWGGRSVLKIEVPGRAEWLCLVEGDESQSLIEQPDAPFDAVFQPFKNFYQRFHSMAPLGRCEHQRSRCGRHQSSPNRMENAYLARRGIRNSALCAIDYHRLSASPTETGR